MRRIPELDYTCSRCGNRETLQLVKVDRHGRRHDDDSAAGPRAIATPDYTCSRCGANETLTLVKMRPAGA